MPRAGSGCRWATLGCLKSVVGGCAPEGVALKCRLYYLSTTVIDGAQTYRTNKRAATVANANGFCIRMVLNDLDRFHLVMDTIDRLSQTGDQGITLKQQLKDKLVEHKQYIDKHGQDLPEIRHWTWSRPE
jgi:hypothetical protein